MRSRVAVASAAVPPPFHASRRLARFGPRAVGPAAGAAALAVCLPHLGDALSQDEVASARILR